MKFFLQFAASNMPRYNSPPYATFSKVSIFKEQDNKQICCINYADIINRKCHMISPVWMVADHLSVPLPQSLSWDFVNRYRTHVLCGGRAVWAAVLGKQLTHLLLLRCKLISTMYSDPVVADPCSHSLHFL